MIQEQHRIAVLLVLFLQSWLFLPVHPSIWTETSSPEILLHFFLIFSRTIFPNLYIQQHHVTLSTRQDSVSRSHSQ